MVTSVYDQIANEAELLSSDEQLRLIARLAGRLAARPAETRPRWEDFAGSSPSPLCGENAQDWVTRTREESDRQRGLPS